MKKMRNAKKLVLLTALCAIISCGGASGGGETANKNPTPTNPVNPNNPVNPGNPNNPSNPVNPTEPNLPIRNGDSRYTKTKLSEMNDKDYLKTFQFLNAAGKNEIKNGEYGYDVINK